MDNLWQKVENIVEKGEIARFVQFLLLSLCFQKAVCLTLSTLIRQFCSRRLWTYFVQKWKISIIEWIYNLWLKVENGEIARFMQFHLLSLCFQKGRQLQRHQKASIWEKGLNCSQNHLLQICNVCEKELRWQIINVLEHLSINVLQ